MAHNDEVLRRVSPIRIGSVEDLAPLFADKWSAGASRKNNLYKALRELCDLNKLQAGKGWFSTPECRSTYEPHARLITTTMVQLKVNYPQSLVFREVSFAPISHRFDIAALLIDGDEGVAAIVECLLAEKFTSYEEKVRRLRSWPGALPFLSGLFHYEIPRFEILRNDEVSVFLKEVSR